MSGITEISLPGAANGLTGVVSVGSAFPGGSTGPINAFLQQYLFNAAGAYSVGALSFENNDIAGGTPYTTGTAASLFEAFTNINSSGSVTGGSVSGSYSVTSGVTDLLVQAPGNETLAGVGSTSVAIFGANSNVDYSVTDPVAGSIYLAGGANSVTLYSTSTTNNESIYSAGNDTINLVGQGTDYVSVYGNAVVEDFGASAHVTAEGNATTNLYWDNANAGGNLTFINNSSAGATIHTGVFVNGATTTTSVSHVTAFGGAGGGYYVGGQGGNNSLVGGTGVVTLVGGGNGDYLSASSGAGQNDFFAGSGSETMVATSTTGANLFQVGLNYPGIGQPAGTGVISTSGSGVQEYFLGNSPGESIYGSTAATFNIYNVVSDATAGGGVFNLYNFTSSSLIYLTDGTATAAGAASISGMGVDQFNSSVYDIGLSDGTLIKIHGLSAAQLSAGLASTVNGSGVTLIY